MLLSLTIKNYALIESLEIDFFTNLSVITGETGAGKSILLGAIGLVLGNRADLNSLKNKEQKCVIEARFQLQNYNLQPIFNQHDLDYEDETIIRREILPSGKSRAFVNDSPVNLSVLQELASYLIDIHSQNQTSNLFNDTYQIELLDSIAQNTSLLTEYQQNLKQLKKAQQKINAFQEEQNSLAKEQEYNQFLLQELVAAQLKSNEQQDLEEEREQLANVELIKESLDKTLAIANNDQVGVQYNLKEIKNAFQKISSFANNYNDLHNRITSITIEFQDILDETLQLTEKLNDNPERLEFINTKLQTIYSLQQKHQVTTISELLQIQQELDEKVIKVDGLQNQIQQLKAEIETITQNITQLANQISINRKKVAPELATKIENSIKQLGIPNAQIAFNFTTLSDFQKMGTDDVQFLFSANQGVELGLLKKTASGGELSRIMLAIKSIVAAYSNLPTIIFDEIDTGVSGEVALKMGEIMKKMSQKMQVFAITHLPQIAAKGSQHYKVFKYSQTDTTVSEIKLLSFNDRVVEIAEMLSGKNISESALQHAKTLLN
ncbi:DNA repair protein RecN [Flavobacterium sp.]|uniref:DNA repair protein RecN n=1 Tax=Flavobacterium sp. TaxID=239 RepID=UPI003529BEF5